MALANLELTSVKWGPESVCRPSMKVHQATHLSTSQLLPLEPESAFELLKEQRFYSHWKANHQRNRAFWEIDINFKMYLRFSESCNRYCNLKQKKNEKQFLNIRNILGGTQMF